MELITILKFNAPLEKTEKVLTCFAESEKCFPNITDITAIKGNINPVEEGTVVSYKQKIGKKIIECTQETLKRIPNKYIESKVSTKYGDEFVSEVFTSYDETTWVMITRKIIYKKYFYKLLALSQSTTLLVQPLYHHYRLLEQHVGKYVDDTPKIYVAHRINEMNTTQKVMYFLLHFLKYFAVGLIVGLMLLAF